MPLERPVISFFTDQNVPDSVGDVLLKAGHKLTRLRDVMDTASPDPIVAVACLQANMVLVTHDKDFKANSKRLGVTQRHYQQHLHRIQLCCLEPQSAGRIQAALTLIEAEWLLSTNDKPMVIEINSQTFLIRR
jgi:predicted nuclease of predicted toxin-antitoxin system